MKRSTKIIAGAAVAAAVAGGAGVASATGGSDDASEGPDVFRVQLEATAARAFVERAVTLVAAGRPPCPLCGQPLDPQGHLCPRRNGHLLN